jgi:hypothetical protein
MGRKKWLNEVGGGAQIHSKSEANDPKSNIMATEDLKWKFEALAQGGRVVDNGKGGWKPSGHTGGGHTGHDGKFKKMPGGKAIVVDEPPKAPPPKKSISDLP